MMKLSQLHYATKKGFNWNELKSDDATRGAYKAAINIRGDVYKNIYFDVKPFHATIIELKWNEWLRGYYVDVSYIENEYLDDSDLCKYQGKIIVAKNVDFWEDEYDDGTGNYYENFHLDCLGEVVGFQRVADYPGGRPYNMLLIKFNEESESVDGCVYHQVQFDDDTSMIYDEMILDQECVK